MFFLRGGKLSTRGVYSLKIETLNRKCVHVSLGPFETFYFPGPGLAKWALFSQSARRGLVIQSGHAPVGCCLLQPQVARLRDPDRDGRANGRFWSEPDDVGDGTNVRFCAFIAESCRPLSANFRSFNNLPQMS